MILAILAILLILALLLGCGPIPTVKVPPTPDLSTPTIPTLTPTPYKTDTPAPTATSRPLTLVFYGDSVLKVGDVNQAPSEGFSIIDPIRASLPVADNLIVSNHGGKRAHWAYENLQENVLRFHPDLVTLWWGLNDLGGCPGIFDRQTNKLVQNQATALINEHILYLRKQIDALLDQGITVFVLTPIPVLGQLPWSHFDANGQLVWENDRHCDFNVGLGQLVQAQRSLLAGYSAANRPVYLVDAWQVYKDNPNADKMYMDVVHPASHGVELIATEWLRVFQSVDFSR